METTSRSIPASRSIGASATTICIVVQFGLAISPLWPSAASGLTSGTTSGTSSCMRQKLVLSTTTAPASTNCGAHSALTAPPAEESTMSRPWIDSSDERPALELAAGEGDLLARPSARRRAATTSDGGEVALGEDLEDRRADGAGRADDADAVAR